MVNIFGMICMALSTLFVLGLFILQWRESSEKRRHDGIVASLYRASAMLGRSPEPMSHANIQHMLSLLTKRQYVDWQYYLENGTFGDD